MKLGTAYSVLYPSFAHFDNIVDNCVVVRGAEEIKDKDAILILHGGEDISPSLYGEEVNSFTGAKNTPSRRDIIEQECFLKAKEIGIPILGICRGAQLACALNGGSLVQHVTGHTVGSHLLALKNGTFIPSNSCHHQMMIPWGTEHELLGWSKFPLSKFYIGEKDEELSMGVEPEIVWFKNSKTLAIQGHPEWLPYNHPLVQYMFKVFMEKLNDGKA